MLARKPIVGSPDGPDEREADTVADAVLAMADSGPASSPSAKVRRKCAGCEGEEEEKKAIRAKSAPGTDAGPSLEVGAAVAAARQGGMALPRETIAYFEPRFGHDFSAVGVHAGVDAANAGSRRSGAVVQRVSADFEVKGRSAQSAGTPGSVFFDRDSSVIDLAEDAKLAAFSAVALSTVTLKGFASEEETGRPALVNARLDAVAARLKAISPGTGDPVKNPELASGIGQIGYRDVRRVEILVAGAASSQPNCSAGADISCGPAPNAFNHGVDAAVNHLLPDAITALEPHQDQEPLHEHVAGHPAQQHDRARSPLHQHVRRRRAGRCRRWTRPGCSPAPPST